MKKGIDSLRTPLLQHMDVGRRHVDAMGSALVALGAPPTLSIHLPLAPAASGAKREIVVTLPAGEALDSVDAAELVDALKAIALRNAQRGRA